MASSTDDHKSLHRLNPFKLAKAIDSAANGKIVNMTKLANNFLFLETNSANNHKLFWAQIHWKVFQWISPLTIL